MLTSYWLSFNQLKSHGVLTPEQDNDKTNVEPVHSYDTFQFHTRFVGPGVKGIIEMHSFNICLVVVLLWCEPPISLPLTHLPEPVVLGLGVLGLSVVTILIRTLGIVTAFSHCPGNKHVSIHKEGCIKGWGPVKGTESSAHPDWCMHQSSKNNQWHYIVCYC